MKFKLIKDSDIKIGLLDFMGEPISNYIFHKDVKKILNGAQERISIWALPLESKMVRMYGCERIWDFRDFPNIPYMPTVQLNHFELELSSLIVSLEKLSLYAIAGNSKLNPVELYFIQKSFIEAYGEMFLNNQNGDNKENTRTTIIDLTTIKKDRIKQTSLSIKKCLLFRLPGTCFAINADYAFIKDINEEKCEYNEIGISNLLNIASVEVKQFSNFDREIIKLLSKTPREIKSEYILGFLENFKNVDFDVASKAFIKNIDSEIKIGHLLYAPSL